MDKILASPGATLEILDRFGIRARKKYGQNFLIDANIVRGIIETAGITQEDCVLEIGPGIGTMTQLLSAAAGRVVSVEIDESLQPVLAETLSDCPNVTILWQDVLKTDLVQVRDEYAPGKRMKVVANLPYYVTTPILMQLLEQKDLFESITVMVQKEVADRLRTGLEGVRRHFSRRAVLCAARGGHQGRAVLLHSPSECGQHGSVPEGLRKAAGGRG